MRRCIFCNKQILFWQKKRKDCAKKPYAHSRCSDAFQVGWEHAKAHWDIYAKELSFPSSAIMYQKIKDNG